MLMLSIRSATLPDGIYLHRLDLADAFEKTKASNEYVAAIKDWLVNFLRAQGDPENPPEGDFSTALEFAEVGVVIKAKFSPSHGGTFFCANDLIRLLEERRDRLVREINDTHAADLGMPGTDVVGEMHDRVIKRIRDIVDDCKRMRRKPHEIQPSNN